MREGLPRWLSSKESVCQCRTPGLGRTLGVGNGNPLQYSYLENSMDREAWWASPWGCKVKNDWAHMHAKWEVKCQSICRSNLPESFLLESILTDVCTIRKDPESEWLVRDNLETNPIMIKLETANHLAKQFLDSLTLLLSAWVPLPNAAIKLKMSFLFVCLFLTRNSLDKKHKLAWKS